MSLLTEAVSPIAWGARINYDSVSWGPWNPDGNMFFHWPGSPRGGATDFEWLRAIEKYHIDVKGWAGIAYSYAVGRDGRVIRLRGENRAGATKGDLDWDGIPNNYESRAYVLLVGTDESITVEQVATMRALVAETKGVAWGHRDVYEFGTGGTNTTCPGDEIYAYVEDLRNNPPTEEVDMLTPITPADAGTTKMEIFKSLLARTRPHLFNHIIGGIVRYSETDTRANKDWDAEFIAACKDFCPEVVASGEFDDDSMHPKQWSELVWNLMVMPVGPKGDKGDDGDPGPKGDAGPKGATPDLTDYIATFSKP